MMPWSSGLHFLVFLVSCRFSEIIYNFHFKGVRADPNKRLRLSNSTAEWSQKWIKLALSHLMSVSEMYKNLLSWLSGHSINNRRGVTRVPHLLQERVRTWRAPLWSQRCQGHVSDRLHQSQHAYMRKALERNIGRRFPVPTCCIVHVSGIWIRVATHPNPLSNNARCRGEN